MFLSVNLIAISERKVDADDPGRSMERGFKKNHDIFELINSEFND